jgi:hypothetical protein
MKLLTKELIHRFRQIGSQEGADDPLVVCKFFSPCGCATWLATEYHEEDRLFFGYASLTNDHNNEWGYFSLDELERIKLPLGLTIERDIHFQEKPISQAARQEGIYFPVKTERLKNKTIPQQA